MHIKIPVVLISILALFSCSDNNTPAKTESTVGDSLVTVNGQSITDADLAITTEKMFARGVASLYAQDINKKALESMVMMMAIAQASAAKAAPEELQEIDSKTQRYREELLTELYMRKFADVTPPTEKQIAEYYDANRVLFGEKTIKQFEIVRTKSKPKGETLKTQLEVLGALDTESWASQTANLKQQKELYEVVASSTDIPNLDASLLRVVNDLNEGEASNVVYVNDKPHVIKVVNTAVKRATPLSEVRARIRKTLAAKKLKQHLKDVSSEILAKADVQYADKTK